MPSLECAQVSTMQQNGHIAMTELYCLWVGQGPTEQNYVTNSIHISQILGKFCLIIIASCEVQCFHQKQLPLVTFALSPCEISAVLGAFYVQPELSIALHSWTSVRTNRTEKTWHHNLEIGFKCSINNQSSTVDDNSVQNVRIIKNCQ
jgi:hypothetical protein